MKLLVATRNRHKLDEIRQILALPGMTLLAADEVPGLPEDVVEDAETFEGNALKKARELCRASGLWTLADDSGLEVDALSGAPGVRSARFAADSGLTDSPDANDNTDVWNNMVLLQRMTTVPLAERTARYRCVLVTALDGVAMHTSEGTVEGVILDAPRGTGGFGYDPLFYVPELDRTMAEIDLETKLSISHRGRAFKALLPLLLK